MAATGPAIFPGTDVFPNTNVYPGQGEQPLVSVLYSTDDASNPSPNWTDATPYVRSGSTSRGRENELGVVDAGLAEIVLDNRTREFDPIHRGGALRPMNRWWIREHFTGVTQDVFKGYAEVYEMAYPGGGLDAVTRVRCTDEFKVLALDNLPTTSPPRNAYRDVVLFDQPSAYWPLDQPGEAGQFAPLAGFLNLAVFDASAGLPVAASTEDDGAIVGHEPSSHVVLDGGNDHYIESSSMILGDAGDVSNLNEMTVEVWVKFETGAGAENIVSFLSPSVLGSEWALTADTDESVTFAAVNSASTSRIAESAAGLIVPNKWIHLVGAIRAGTIYLYADGVEVGTDTWTGVFGAIDSDPEATFDRITVSQGTHLADRHFSDLAIYRYGLPADRILAHHEAGRARGFPRGHLPGSRMQAVLDSVGSNAPRSIRTGSREMIGAYMTGQPPLDELRNAERADAVDAVLFIARDGTITFLDDGHRSVSPWNTVQATFDDDGTDLPYHDLTPDFSDAFLFNAWHVTPTGGTTASASDATSISKYDTRPRSLTDIPIRDSADASAIASAMLAKYKDPMNRITSLNLSTHDPDVTEAVFALDIGSRIRVFRTPPGGGSRIDQTLFVQKIDVEMAPGVPWRIRLGVSPL